MCQGRSSKLGTSVGSLCSESRNIYGARIMHLSVHEHSSDCACITYANILHHFMQRTTLHQFMEELLDARILMHYSIVQEHTRKWPNFLQESCITLCKIHTLLYARFLHYLCKNLDLKILHSSCKTLAKNLQVMHDHLQETAFSCSKVITIILQDLARLVWLKH